MQKSQPLRKKSCSDATKSAAYTILSLDGGDRMKIVEQHVIPMNSAVRRFLLVIKILAIVCIAATGGLFK